MPVIEPPEEGRGSSLGDDQRLALLVALEDWANRHPAPDRPLVGFGSGEFVSPRGLVESVRSGSDPGLRYLESVKMILEEVPFDVYLASVRRSGRPRWRPFRLALEFVARLRPAPISSRRRVPGRRD